MDAYYLTRLRVGEADWFAGDVIRLHTTGPFMDAVILGFNDDGLALLSRPYAYASCTGTTGPTILLGAERMAHYRITRDTKRVGEGRRA